MTLLEVLVAMVIVTIGVLAVLQSQAASHALLRRVQSHDRLAILAEGAMERIVARRQTPAAGRLAGRFDTPNDDVSWPAVFRPAGVDPGALVRIDLSVTGPDGGVTLGTERYWP